MLEKFKNLLLYGGVDRLNFERIKSSVQRINRMMTIVLSASATILTFVMVVLSLSSTIMSRNKFVYELGLIFSLAILFLSLFVVKKNYWLIRPLVYISYSIYFLYGIMIGTITDPGEKTVTFMVVLVFIPTLFIDRPIHIMGISTVYVIIFIILCFIKKEEPVLSVDIANAIIFGILGITSGIIVNHVKIHNYVLEHKLQEISRIDQLTQIKNRNAYELEYDSIPNKCKQTLACLYIDANGLHEVNNSKGHEYGDKLLKGIAKEIRNTFSNDYLYRIGGDEFVIFIPDMPKEKLDTIIVDMLKRLKAEEYYVAIGYDISTVKHILLDDLIKSAESKMFQNKKNYYKEISNRDVRK